MIYFTPVMKARPSIYADFNEMTTAQQDYTHISLNEFYPTRTISMESKERK